MDKIQLSDFSEMAERNHNEFEFRGRRYVWCGFAEGLGYEIISYVCYDVAAKRYAYLRSSILVTTVSFDRNPL